MLCTSIAAPVATCCCLATDASWPSAAGRLTCIQPLPSSTSERLSTPCAVQSSCCRRGWTSGEVRLCLHSHWLQPSTAAKARKDQPRQDTGRVVLKQWHAEYSSYRAMSMRSLVQLSCRSETARERTARCLASSRYKHCFLGQSDIAFRSCGHKASETCLSERHGPNAPEVIMCLSRAQSRHARPQHSPG